ncbi:hypothetical protein [Isoptericola variabilis]|uniref:hypothetical protein n=1 Tax=Isoptericola variabilis TaxID=139208 RepID=UPI0002D3E493|nr:hypothetical protein [Isoptericola variabilis]TWH28203.1 hypothetical protein L600_004400000190 [Isoptericola variabilis J7]
MPTRRGRRILRRPCHRSLVGDALLARGVDVVDIVSATSARSHTLRPFAQVEGTRVWYPPEADDASA